MICYTNKHHTAFQIDEADYEAVSQYGWYVNAHGYPTTNIGKRPARGPIYLHEFLLGPAPDGLHTDHINRDKTDNRRANLRFVTRTINMRNTGKNASNVSGVKGVSWASRDKKWRAEIRMPGRKINLGWFSTLQEAAAARLAAEELLWEVSEEA
jgi:hypothetical protein